MSKSEMPDNETERIAQLFSQIARAMRGGKPPGTMKSSVANLTMAQGRCLWIITKHESCTLRELSQKLGVRPSTASELVEKLVRARFVKRAIDAQDRRTVRLTLTKKGRDLHSKHQVARREHMHKLLNHLTARQRKDMLSAIEVLNGVVQQAQQETQLEK